MTFQYNEQSSQAIKPLLLMRLFLCHYMNQAFNNKSKWKFITSDLIKRHGILAGVTLAHKYYLNIYNHLCQNNLFRWDPLSSTMCSTNLQTRFNNSLRNSTDVGRQSSAVISTVTSQREGAGFYFGVSRLSES